MLDDAPDLPPLWSEPLAFGHNGGPPLDEPRRVGQPTVSTPEVRLDPRAAGRGRANRSDR